MLQVFVTLVVASCCIVAIISASKIESEQMLSKVEVHINSGKKYHFIEETQILNETINNRNIDIMHTPVKKLDIQTMEQVLKADPWVADATLYVDAKRVLHMSVTQRIPVARLFEQNGTSCYMDNTLSIMPLAPNFIYYTSVITNVPMLGTDSLGTAIKKQMLMLVHTIQADTFWNAQISQIIVDSDYSFELIPVLGQQKIIFGDTSRMKEKFNNLFAFYKNVLNRIGWDKYDMLDVRFKGQVVASPSLPYKGPVDRATNNMNWISSIVETEARKDSLHALSVAKVKEPEEAGDKDKVKKETKPDVKDKAKVVANAAHKEVKKEIKKEVKKDAKREVKKDDRKDKKDVKKDSHPAKEHVVKKEEKGSKEKPKEKGKPKYTLKGE